MPTGSLVSETQANTAMNPSLLPHPKTLQLLTSFLYNPQSGSGKGSGIGRPSYLTMEARPGLSVLSASHTNQGRQGWTGLSLLMTRLPECSLLVGFTWPLWNTEVITEELGVTILHLGRGIRKNISAVFSV